MTSTRRPVWLTRKQRDDWTWIANQLRARNFAGFAELVDEQVAAWDEAPEDAAGAIVEWFNANFVGADESGDSVLNGAREILGALGCSPQDATSGVRAAPDNDVISPPLEELPPITGVLQPPQEWPLPVIDERGGARGGQHD